MADSIPHQATKRLLTVVMAIVMITSMFAGAALAQQAPTDSDIADEVYVNDEGDAVLVYEDDTVGTETGEFGVDVAEGIVYALVSDDIEDDISAAFDMWVDPDGIDGSTEFVAERPDEIEDFSMDVTGATTDEESQFDATLGLSVDTSEEPMAEMVEASTDGTVESSVDHVASSGQYHFGMDAPPAEPTERIDVAVAGTAGDYTLDVHQTTVLSQYEVDRWETEADAQATIEQEFGAIAQEFGGDADVTIHAHDLEYDAANNPVLDVEFTVEYDGLDGIAQFLADDLADDPELDLTQAEAEAFVDGVFDLELDPVAFSHSQDDTTVEGEWDVDVSGTAPLAHGTVDLLEAADEDGELAELGVLDELRDDLEAQEASNLVQTVEWDAELASDGPETATFDAALSGESENWQAYLDELEDRGIDQQIDMTFEAHGETVGDDVEFEMAMEVAQDDLFETSLAMVTQELENDPTVPDETLEFWNAFADSDFEVAGIDVDSADGTMTMTAGASFDDFSAFQGLLEDEFHGLSVTHVYSDVSEDTTTGYLYVDGMVGDDPTEDEVRDTELVGDETEIHLDATLEDHPRLDLEEAGEFLGVDAGDEDEDEDEDDSIPGFGAVAAIAVLLSVALLRIRN